jgi:hypothetical protein
MDKNSFQEKMSLGKVGEEIVEKSLVSAGYVPYQASDKLSHPFDFIVLNPKSGNITAVEVKYKIPFRTGNVGLYIDMVQDYKRQKKKFNLKELWIAFVSQSDNSIKWVEIDTKWTTVITDKGGKRLVIWEMKK